MAAVFGHALARARAIQPRIGQIVGSDGPKHGGDPASRGPVAAAHPADIDYGFREAITTYGRIGVKVWIYRGQILPYRVQTEDKISREAAMAVGEAADGAPGKPRRVISSGGRAEAAPEGEAAPEEKPAPLLGEADPEFEKLLDAEEEIDRLSRENSETERFRPGQGD